VTVTPELRLEVRGRLREEFDCETCTASRAA